MDSGNKKQTNILRGCIAFVFIGIATFYGAFYTMTFISHAWWAWPTTILLFLLTFIIAVEICVGVMHLFINRFKELRKDDDVKPD